jgi:uncharacterized protein (UPF0335 family)
MDAFSHDLLQITTETSDSNTIVTENLLNRIERLEKRLAVQELYADEIDERVDDLESHILDSFKQIKTKIIAINRRFIRFFCYVMPLLVALRHRALATIDTFGKILMLTHYSSGKECGKMWHGTVNNIINGISSVPGYAKMLFDIQIPYNPRIIEGTDIQDGDNIHTTQEFGDYKFRTATLEEVTRWKAEEQEFFESMV